MLRLNELDVSIGSRVLIERFCALWPAGSLVAILGPNGIGKTTLLNNIAGIRLRASKKIYLQGTDLFLMTPLERARHISSIPQHDSAPHDTTVFDRISHGLYPVKGSLEGASEEVAQLAAEIGIKDLLDRPLHALSGGQRKKVHIARALVHKDADLFVLDEPDASLDSDARVHILNLLKALSREKKLVIVSLHNRDLAAQYADIIVDLAYC
jgi:ABC-type cobalamin/Fe3+-siderophores transport system ATPase subunit